MGCKRFTGRFSSLTKVISHEFWLGYGQVEPSTPESAVPAPAWALEVKAGPGPLRPTITESQCDSSCVSLSLLCGEGTGMNLLNLSETPTGRGNVTVPWGGSGRGLALHHDKSLEQTDCHPPLICLLCSSQRFALKPLDLCLARSVVYQSRLAAAGQQ